MLEYFRSRRNPIVLYFITGLVCLVMLSFGVTMYQYRSRPNWVLKVNSEEVPMKYFLASYQQTLGYFQNLLQGQFNPSLLQYFQVDQVVINNLKEQELVSYMAYKLDLLYSPQFVKDRIFEQDVFKDKNGFSYSRYKNFLSRGTVLSPISPKKYEAYIGKNYLLQTLGRSVRGSFVLTDHQKTVLKALRKPEFKLEIFELTTTNLQVQIKPSKAEIEAFANDEKNLTLIQNAYFSNIDRFKTKDTFQAKHILFSVSESASEDELETALSQAQGAYQTLTEDPSQFESMAMEISGDPGSKEKGGDLGTFTAGDMVKPFEDALRSLEPGVISEPIKSQFGYHIAVLENFTPEKTTSMEEVKSELAKEVLVRLKKEELIGLYKPILVSHFEKGQTKDVERILEDKLKIKGVVTDFVSPYQADIPQLGKEAYHLKKYLLQHKDSIKTHAFFSELITANNKPFVIRVHDQRIAFSDKQGETTGDPMKQFYDQIEQKWQDHLYTLFKTGLEDIFTVQVNQAAIDAFKRRTQAAQAAQ